jgi:hypothetical protein
LDGVSGLLTHRDRRDSTATRTSCSCRATPRTRPATAIATITPTEFGNRDILAGAQYDPRVLTGLSMWQIATQFEEPSSWVAKAIDGSADVLIRRPRPVYPPRIAGPDLLAYCCSG